MAANQELGNLIWKITGDTRNLDRNMKRSEKKADDFSTKLRSVGKKIGVAFAAIGAAKLAKEMISLAISAEQTKVSFTTFLKSAEKADKLINTLENFSVVTPFTISQINKAAKSMLGMGFAAKDLVPNMKKIGDIAAGTGKDFNELSLIFAKAKTAGTLFSEDINQLLEAGVPILGEFAKQLGVTEGEVKKLASEGKISFGNLETAFTDLTAEGGLFFNLMEDQSVTLGGRLSTLEGNLSLLGAAIGANFTDAIGAGVDILNNLLTTEVKLSAEITRQKDALIEEKFVLNARFEVLKKGEATDKNRLQLIGDINKVLIKHNKTLLTEKSTLQDIEKAQAAVNVVLLENIRILAQKEILQDLIQEQSEIAAKAIAVEKALLLNRISLEKNLQKLRDAGVVGRGDLARKIAGDKRAIKVNKVLLSSTLDLLAAKNEEITQFRELTGIVLDNTDAKEDNAKVTEDAGKAGAEVVEKELTALEKLIIKLGKVAQAYSVISSSILDVASAVAESIQIGIDQEIEALTAKEEAEIEALDAKTERELEYYNVTEETKIRSLEREAEAASKAGDDQLASEIANEQIRTKILQEAAAEKKKIEEKAAKEKAALEYKGALLGWKLQLAAAVSAAPVAIINAFSSAAAIPYVGMVLGPIAAIAAGVTTAIQIANIAKSKPIMSYDVGTGNVTSDQVAQIHKGEVIIPANFSESLRKGELELSGGGATESAKALNVTIQIVSDSGEILDEYIHNGTRDGTIKIDERALVST